MLRKSLLLALTVVFCFACKKPEKVAPPVVVTTTVADSTNVQHISVLTQHNDNTRAGLNSQETALTTSNVSAGHFGKLFIMAVDNEIYAQPLIVGNVNIQSKTRNLALVATVNNSVYAFDADNGKLYWSNNYTASGMRPPKNTDMNSDWCTPYTDFDGYIGIAGTPVIDSVSQTIYFVARSTSGSGASSFVQYLHAVNIVTGAEQPGSPMLITASVAGTGTAGINGMVSFDPMRNNQRMGLALVNGVVYIAFSSHCDWNPYHGWILGYDAKTLQQRNVYCDTPNGEEGGIWESGMGIAADQQGNLYVTTGNGTVGTPTAYSPSLNGSDEPDPSPDPTDLSDRAESALKLTPSGNTLQVTSYFTPTNYVYLNTDDRDYGVMGTLLIPNSSIYITGCKDGNLYVLNKDNMGGYSGANNQVVATLPMNSTMHCQPAYYNGPTGQFLYIWPETLQLQSLSISTSGIVGYNSTLPGRDGPTFPGAQLSVSSNGTKSGTGILWAYYNYQATTVDTRPQIRGILRAFDATDITKELWNSEAIVDYPGAYAKFCAPTIANGKVYIGTFSNQVVVYGLKN